MGLKVGARMPSLEGATEWLNSPATPFDLEGRIVIVHFWAISCPTCKHNMPNVQALQRDYERYHLAWISVHMPRMESDLDVFQVRKAIDQLGMTEPCAIDNEHTIGDLFQTNELWPCYFLFNHEGFLKSHAAGEMGLKMVEVALKRLLDHELMAR